jgi:hypothetical protein
MLRLLSDEDVNGNIVDGLLEHGEGLDLVRAADVGLGHTPDERILEWAAAEGRVLITGDLNTMVGFAWDRVRQKQPMPGVFALRGSGSVGQIVEDILTASECYTEEEMSSMAVIYMPIS